MLPGPLLGLPDHDLVTFKHTNKKPHAFACVLQLTPNTGTCLQVLSLTAPPCLVELPPGHSSHVAPMPLSSKTCEYNKPFNFLCLPKCNFHAHVGVIPGELTPQFITQFYTMLHIHVCIHITYIHNNIYIFIYLYTEREGYESMD